MRKLLLAATAIAALVAAALSSAHATTVIDDQMRLDFLEGECRAFDGPNAVTDKACDAVNKLIEKLGTRGYCVYGHGVIGRAGKGHCYEIKAISRGDYLKEQWTEKRCLATKTDCVLMPDGNLKPRLPEGPEGDQ